MAAAIAVNHFQGEPEELIDIDLLDIDLLDVDAFADGVPYGWFAHLRAEAPVYRHPEPDGPGFWVISRHEDVRLIGRDPSIFSSAAELGGIDALVDGEPATLTDGNMLPLMDPPGHTHYRKIVHDSFRPRSVRPFEEEIRANTARLLDRVVGCGAHDFVDQVASELPSQAISVMLGLPAEDCRMIVAWSAALVENEHRDPDVRHAEGRAAFEEIRNYAAALAEDRRRSPRNDILTVLVDARVEGQPLGENDFANFLVLLGTAGEETTRNSLAHAIAAFIDAPSQFDVLRHDRSAVDTAVEEILRWATPALYFRRTATCDTTIRGVPIRAGDKVSLWYISANRDETVFEDPHCFDVRRTPNDHVAFGHGPHFCLGSHLARLEIRVFLEELRSRVRTIEPAGDVVRLQSNAVHGIKQLPVSFSAA